MEQVHIVGHHTSTGDYSAEGTTDKVSELQDVAAAETEASCAMLTEQHRQWDRRPVLRMVYSEYFRRMVAQMARDASGSLGCSIEIGCGGGFFKDYCSEIVATDLVSTPWADQVVDCQDMPYDDGSLRNIVMFDVLHHLADLPRFLGEAIRVLEPDGRLVMVEPYISPCSRVVYGLFHREPHQVSGDPFVPYAILGAHPMDGNQGIPNHVFFSKSGRRKLTERFGELRLRRAARIGLWTYPCSGGFSGPVLIPAGCARLLLALEVRLEPLLGPLLAHKSFIVLERR